MCFTASKGAVGDGAKLKQPQPTQQSPYNILVNSLTQHPSYNYNYLKLPNEENDVMLAPKLMQLIFTQPMTF